MGVAHISMWVWLYQHGCDLLINVGVVYVIIVGTYRCGCGSHINMGVTYLSMWVWFTYQCGCGLHIIVGLDCLPVRTNKHTYVGMVCGCGLCTCV